MRIFYTLSIRLYALAIRLVAPFHPKARQMVRGWRDSWKALQHFAEKNGITEGRQPFDTLWFHASSMGEFEQARPVLELLRQQHPDSRIVVTFFSPSGYEMRKNYDQADLVIYLPPDTRRNARKLIALIQPTTAFFVKYDFWFNYLDSLYKKEIPTYLFSAIFRPSQYFFRWYGRWFCHRLAECFTYIFVQNEVSLQLLKSHGVGQCSRAGDTRFDRVKAIAGQARRFDAIERYLAQHTGVRIVIAGSCWPPDEQVMQTYIQRHPEQETVWILAPHHIAESHLADIEQRFSTCRPLRYSSLDETDEATLRQSRVIIIDNIGMLSSLYRYADVACIGGGFGVGIHNTQEAITFGKPVLFGPNYKKFQEAHDLLACNGGFTFHDIDTFDPIMTRLLTDDDHYRAASAACTTYVDTNLGSSRTIVDHLIRTLLTHPCDA